MCCVIKSDKSRLVPATESESVCDFEEDMCGWTNRDQDQFDWLIGVGKTLTVLTGPSWDHTYGDGLRLGESRVQTHSPLMRLSAYPPHISMQ